MKKHAVVRGEVHVSNTDRKALFNRDLSDYQALCMEGRSDTIQLHKYTNRYILYLIGYFTLELLYRSTSVIHSIIGSEEYDVEQEAEKHGLEYEDEIDLEIHEIYESYDHRLKKWLPLALIGIFLFALLGAFVKETVSFYGINTGIPYWLVVLIAGLLIPFMYSGLLMMPGEGRDRDEEMAEEINSFMENRDYGKILVLVGDKHVEPVSNELENHGWEIDRERSSHWLARLRRLFPE